MGDADKYFIDANIAPDYEKFTKGIPGEVKRRWVNQQFVEDDIRAGWNHVYTDTGEIVSRPASDNKRAFLLEHKISEELKIQLIADHLVIDGESERVEEYDNKTEQGRLHRLEKPSSNEMGD